MQAISLSFLIKITAKTDVSWENVTLTFIQMSVLHNAKMCIITQILVLHLAFQSSNYLCILYI